MAIKLGLHWQLDISFYDTITDDLHPRLYQLNQFSIIEQYVKPSVSQRFTNPSFIERRARQLSLMVFPYYRQKIVREQQLDYDDNMWKVRDNSYLFGYWQDIRYFIDIEDILRKELLFLHEPDHLNRDWLDRITKANSICLHIRRGDYITDITGQECAGPCSLEYYHQAINQLGELVSDPCFFVFSDDIEWAVAHLKIKFPHSYIRHNGEARAVEDLRLMKACRHHILSNSSFSWWAAWMGYNDQQQVIVPGLWRLNGPQMYFPAHWRKI